jgi:hypothetical protein
MHIHENVAYSSADSDRTPNLPPKLFTQATTYATAIHSHKRYCLQCPLCTETQII